MDQKYQIAHQNTCSRTITCSLHVKELKVTTTELERQVWDQSRKTTKQLLDCAITGRLLYSYWKAENTAISIKEMRKQW